MPEETTIMSNQEDSSNGSNTAEQSESLPDSNHELAVSAKNLEVENGIANGEETQEQLAQRVMELSFQNDYLKAQIGGMKSEDIRSVEMSNGDNNGNGQVGDASGEANRLREKIESLNKEIQEQKETQKAAEKALEHLRVSYSEADAKVQELTTKLAEG